MGVGGAGAAGDGEGGGGGSEGWKHVGEGPLAPSSGGHRQWKGQGQGPGLGMGHGQGRGVAPSRNPPVLGQAGIIPNRTSPGLGLARGVGHNSMRRVLLHQGDLRFHRANSDTMAVIQHHLRH
ncbi:unnamed protein product, partial [Discosporangium mesarthrocarpum]